MQVSNIGLGQSQQTTSAWEDTQWVAWIGRTGSGKTTSLAKWLLSYHLRTGRLMHANFYILDGTCNHTGKHVRECRKRLHKYFRPLNNLEDLRSLKNCAVGIDELGSKYVPSHHWNSPQNQLYMEIASNLRKQHVNFGWTDQEKNRVDHNFRGNVDHWRQPFMDHENTSIDTYYYKDQTHFEAGDPIPLKIWTAHLRTGKIDQWINREVFNYLDSETVKNIKSQISPDHLVQPEQLRIAVNSAGVQWKIAGQEPLVITMEEPEIRQYWRFFDSEQIIPRLPKFQWSEQLTKYRKWLEDNHEKPSKGSLAKYETTTEARLTGTQRTAILYEVSQNAP